VVATPLAVAVGDTVPHGAGEQVTAHVTPWFDGSLPTVAVKGALAPGLTVSDCGLTDRVNPETVTVAVLETVELATEVAVIVTPRSLAGGVLGAV
jgi:hypothetical protein